MFLSTISSNQILAVRRIELEHIAVALRLKTDAKAGGRKKFVYSHIDNCRSITVTIQDSGISVYISIRKIGRLVVAGVDGGRPLSQMIVGLSGIANRGSAEILPFVPVLLEQFPP